MTHPEIYQQLKLVPTQTWLEMKQLLSEQSYKNRLDYFNNIDKSAPKPIDFLFTAVVEDDDYNGRAGRQSLPYVTLSNNSLFRQQGRHRNDHTPFLANLPVEFIQYLPTNIATRLKKEVRKREIANNTKSIQLNEFSYQVFKAQLQNAKKKLAGNEVIAQIKTLPNPTSIEERIYYDKFLALFWDNSPKKSKDLCQAILRETKQTEYAPVVRITDITGELTNTQFTQNDVHITLYAYQRLALTHNIPTLLELHTDRYSEHHDWITGVPKPTKLNSKQLEVTLSQILVLEYVVNYLQTPDNQCPYFKKVLAQLTEELAKPEYKAAIKPLLESMSNSTTSIASTIQNLKAM